MLSSAIAERTTPASRFGKLSNAWSSVPPESRKPKGFAEEATVASSGVVENAVDDRSRTLSGYAPGLREAPRSLQV